jgi:hypothetical protein
MNRVLKRLDESSRTAEKAESAPVALHDEPAVERVELPPLDFLTGEPVEIEPPAPPPPPEPVGIPAPRAIEAVTLLEDPARQRVRDAYIAARFPGVARSSRDLARVRSVINAANVYLEDGESRRAEELLDVAAELLPASEKLLLARLELALRLRDSEGYRRTGLRFRERHPRSPHWKYIVAFAQTIYLTEAPFTADVTDPFGDGAYQRPNWLGDALELAPEFAPTDLRKRVLADDAPELERKAA